MLVAFSHGRIEQRPPRESRSHLHHRDRPLPAIDLVGFHLRHEHKRYKEHEPRPGDFLVYRSALVRCGLDTVVTLSGQLPELGAVVVGLEREEARVVVHGYDRPRFDNSMPLLRNGIIICADRFSGVYSTHRRFSFRAPSFQQNRSSTTSLSSPGAAPTPSHSYKHFISACSFPPP